MKRIVFFMVTLFLMGGVMMAQGPRDGKKMDPKARAEKMSKAFYALLQQPAHTGAKPRKAVHVQRASLQCGGHLQGVHFVKAVHAAAANKERRNL